jgi:hypothetical protein
MPRLDPYPGIRVITIEAQIMRSMPPRMIFRVGPALCKSRIMVWKLHAGNENF